jgi:hypothetical protein
MPNSTSLYTETIEEFEEEDEFSRDDFVIVVGPDGELKSLVYPEHLMEEPPEEVLAILNMFGIEDFDSLEQRVLH